MNTTIMYGYKKTARIVGVLYIIGTVAGIASVPFLSIRNASNYLVEIANSPNTLVFGAILELVMGFALAMIPVFMFPILRIRNEVVGVGYIVFRGALETFTYIIQAICFLALSSLATAYAAGGIQNAENFHIIGKLLQDIIELPMGMFVFGTGALIFYFALYKYRLVPKWLSVFGIIAILLHIVSGFMVLYGLQVSFDTSSLIMNLPIALQEMVLAVWFIVKGFRINKTHE